MTPSAACRLIEAAGADVLFAPALPTLDAVRTVCASVSKPVNFMVGIPGKSFTVAELTEAGVRRISLATSLYRAAMTGLVDAAREIRDSGSFGYLDRMMPGAEFSGYFKKPRHEALVASRSPAGRRCGGARRAAAVPTHGVAAGFARALARAKGLHFGTSLGGRGLGDPRYLELIRAECGILVPENELKMPSIQPRPGEFSFERGDALVAFAQGNDMRVRGQCLLWHHPRWLPRWMNDYDFGAEPAQAAERLLHRPHRAHRHALRQTHSVLGRGERGRRQRHRRHARDAAVESHGLA